MDPPSTDLPAREAVLAFALIGLFLGTAAAPGTAQAGEAAGALAERQVDADAVLLSVALQEDGDARWRVEYRVRLDDENTTAAFEQLQADVDRNESVYVFRFEERMSTTVGDAADSTGRSMALRNVSVTTTTQELPQRYGVLVYTFEWTNFAAVEGDQLRTGDALAGFFLDDDSSLSISWPAGYSVVAVSPEPTEQRAQTVTWRGPADFGPDEPTLVVSTGGPTDGVAPSFVGLAVVAVVLVGGGALWWWRRRPIGATPTTGSAEAGSAEAEAGDWDRPPEELLSNEERVVALLEDHGGRMKQQDVVEALGWTDAKTSQVVGKLRDAGDVEGFRLGRENVLRLPEVDESPAPGEVRPGEDDE